jgi:hypothetical protein
MPTSVDLDDFNTSLFLVLVFKALYFLLRMGLNTWAVLRLRSATAHPTRSSIELPTSIDLDDFNASSTYFYIQSSLFLALHGVEYVGSAHPTRSSIELFQQQFPERHTLPQELL